jgi:hypothetical protein
MANPTIHELENELITLVKSVPEFEKSGFSCYNLEDLMQKTELQTFPLVGVCYNGSAIAPSTNPSATASDLRSNSIVLVEHQYLVVIGIQYQYSVQVTEDTKATATDLLDQIRPVILGYRGVNSRPWRWVGESPETNASSDGVVFYSQVWHTTVPAISNS